MSAPAAPPSPDLTAILPVLISFLSTYGTQILKWVKNQVIPNMDLPLSLRWVKAVLNAFLGAILAGGSSTVIDAGDPAMMALAGAGIGVIQALGYKYNVTMPGVKKSKE